MARAGSHKLAEPMIKSALAVALMFGLVACSPAHYQGVVTAKNYLPANFNFNVELDNGREEVQVSQADYIRLRVGMRVAITDQWGWPDVTILSSLPPVQVTVASAGSMVPHG